MKKILIIFFLFISCFFIFKLKDNNNNSNNYNSEKRGVFVSYIEIGNYIKDNNINVSKLKVDKMIDNIISMNFNLVILQVRSFSDAIYKSDIYPWSSVLSGEEGKEFYDLLDYFIKKAHSMGILVYAWINPYRVRGTEDINSISKLNPAYKYIGSDVLYVKNGIYYNPSKVVVNELIVEGVKEIINNYDVDGILFDDYFYPDNEIDLDDYNSYLKDNDYISLDNYHLMIINNMVSDVYSICNENNILFGISPDGNISNNYNKNYADIKSWMSSDKYIDFIMPQIYYGFYNESRDFIGVLREWESLLKNNNIELMIALAFYKVGVEDNFAKDGKFEWINNDNIIMREIILSRNIKNYSGFSLFRYGYLFDEELFSSTTMREIENMKEIIK